MFPNLEDLDLWHLRITDQGLRQLRGLHKLKSLHLDDNGISDAGLPALAGLTGLEKLYLDQNPVTDKGLEQLRKLTHLKRLGLCLTKVSGAGVRKLQAALPKCRIVREGSGKPITSDLVPFAPRKPQLSRSERRHLLIPQS